MADSLRETAAKSLATALQAMVGNGTYAIGPKLLGVYRRSVKPFQDYLEGTPLGPTPCIVLTPLRESLNPGRGGSPSTFRREIIFEARLHVDRNAEFSDELANAYLADLERSIGEAFLANGFGVGGRIAAMDLTLFDSEDNQAFDGVAVEVRFVYETQIGRPDLGI